MSEVKKKKKGFIIIISALCISELKPYMWLSSLAKSRSKAEDEIKVSVSSLLVGFLGGFLLPQKILHPSQFQVLGPEYLAFYFLLRHNNMKIIFCLC